MQTGETVVFSVRPGGAPDGHKNFQVSYEGFVDDVRVGDYLMVDGGMAIVRVSAIEGPDVKGEVVEPGRVMSRANITLRRSKQLVRGNSSMLPVVTAKDWQDIDFAVANKACSLLALCAPPSLCVRLVACTAWCLQHVRSCL
jgi:pyruvate kinase